MDESEPNEALLSAAQRYRATLDERYENISAIIAEKCDKNWLREKCTSEDEILEECVRLCSE